MSTYAVLRIVVVLLVLLPLASAVAMPLFGRFARRAALLGALVHLGLTAAVVAIAFPALDYRRTEEATVGGDSALQRFRPEFVPGDPGADRQSEGAEGRTTWTLLRLSAVESAAGRPGPSVQLFLGIDGLNLWLVVLASILMPPAVLVSWSVADRPGAFFGWLFLLQAGLIGAFLSFDVILFYVFFELTLIPAFFLIGSWGVGSGRRDAARKFFLYTLAGSLLTLLGVIGVVVANPTPLHPNTGVRMNAAVERAVAAPGQPPGEWHAARRGPPTFSLPDLMGNVQVWADAPTAARAAVATAERELAAARAQPDAARAAAAERRLDAARQLQADADRERGPHQSLHVWLFVALMAGFMVKVPIWPFHTWLPGAYGEAPTGAVVLLSAVMSKLGTFGIARLVLPLVPDAAIRYGLPVVGVLAAFGIVYAALCAYASKDIKLVFAYSSVSHLGFLVLGLFAFNREGLTGSVLHMVNHGLSTGALFAGLGFLAVRYRTTEQARFGGLMGRFPNYALLMFVLCLASVGLPGLNNFVGEMLMMAGLFDARNAGANRLGLAVVAAVGIFLSAWYTLTVLKRVFFGPPKEPEPVGPAPDVTRREFLAFGSLALLCVLLGLFPQPVIDTLKADVRVLSVIGDKARARIDGVPYVYVDDEPPRAAPAPTVGPAAKGPPGGAKGGPPGGGKGGGRGGAPGGKGGKGGGPGGKGGPPGDPGVKGPMPPPGED